MYSNIEEIKQRWKEILEPTKHGFICPLCGNGKGSSKTGITDNHGNNILKCFKCGFSGDIIQLYEEYYEVDFKTAVESLANKLNITLHADNSQNLAASSNLNAVGEEVPTNNIKQLKTANKREIKLSDYTEFYRKANEVLQTNAAALDYLASRNISLSTANKFNMGYCENWQSPTAALNNKQTIASKRLIMPVSNNYYIARAVDNNTIKAMNETGGGSVDILNKQAITSNVCFVLEGMFDALSVEECGYNAVALNSTANVNKFIEYIKELQQHGSNVGKLIISLDNDDSGHKATERLITALKQLKVKYITYNISSEYKDANDIIKADKQQLINNLKNAVNMAMRPNSVSSYLANCFETDIKELAAQDGIKTGFSELDKLTDGLHAGLYCIGAISSLGKTTFCLQLADNIAENGKDILFYSLEQSKLELVSKSLARTCKYINSKSQLSSLDIRKGTNNDTLNKAITSYAANSERLSIIEGNATTTIESIIAAVVDYIKYNKTKPIVIIDYLQLLETAANYSNKKDKIDFIVTELKRLSRDYKLTVIAISSINRSNYLTSLDFESFKESGGIEYTADFVCGLQLSVLHQPIFNQQNKLNEKRELIAKAKASDVRLIDFVCLKNRFGVSSFSCGFKYQPKFDLFESVNAVDFEKCYDTAFKNESLIL